MAGRTCAGWRFPTEKQARTEKTLMRMQQNITPLDSESRAAPSTSAGPGDPMPGAYWAASSPSLWLVRSPASTSATAACERSRASGFRAAAAIVPSRFRRRTLSASTGSTPFWKDVGMKLLDSGCQERTGVREYDGCWPSYDLQA